MTRQLILSLLLISGIALAKDHDSAVAAAQQQAQQAAVAAQQCQQQMAQMTQMYQQFAMGLLQQLSQARSEANQNLTAFIMSFIAQTKKNGNGL